MGLIRLLLTLVIVFSPGFDARYYETMSICDACACRIIPASRDDDGVFNQSAVSIECKNVFNKLGWRNVTLSHGTVDVWLTVKNDHFTPFQFKKIADIFAKRNITRLILDNNNIETLPEYFFSVIKSSALLTSVSLSRNKISYLNDATFAGLKNLKYLNVANNEINRCDLDAFILPNIQKLNLHSNKIKSVNVSKCIDSLEELDLSNNLLTELGAFSDALPNLKILNVSNNLITNISNSFYSTLNKLEVLDLSHNKLMHFDLADKTLPSIRVINLNNNLLSRITILNTHDKLKNLNLCHNKLLSIDILPDNNKLEILNVSHNSIVDPTKIKNLRYIKVLDVSNNEIQELPKDLPKGLRELYLSGNKISSIPRLTSKVLGLLKLDLSHTPSLTELAKNAFQDFFPKSSDNFNCTILDLSMSSISKIDDQSFDGAKLCKINLSGNKITLLPKGSLNWTTVEIDLQKNPLYCTCPNQWLIDTLIPSLYQRNPTLLTDLRCSEPKEYYQKRLVYWYNHTNDKTLCQPPKLTVQNAGNSWNTFKDIKLTISLSMILTFSILGILAALLVWVAFALKRKNINNPRKNRRLMK